jgi:glycosyltransferase involved in cell wall biosynthesis
MAVRVLFACETGQISGAETVLLTLLAAVDRAAYEPRAVCPPNGPLAQRLAASGVPVDCVHVPRLRRNLRSLVRELPRLPRFSRWLRAYLRDQQIELVHCNSFGAQLACAGAAVDCGIPTVWHMHDILKRRRSNGWLLRRTARSADRIICVSEAVARELEAWDIPPHKLQVIYNGLDLETHFQPRAASGLLRAQFGLPPRTRLVGIIGQLAPWKGQHVFLRAAGLLNKDRPDVAFVIVGAPLFGGRRYQERLERIAREAGIEGSVIFAGRRDDIPQVLAELEILVHASVLPDPLPTVLLEAGACAKPVVAAACGGVAEIVADGQTGLLVPPGDAEAMSAALDRLLADREAATAMGIAARHRVQRRFSIDGFVRGVEQVYREVLGRPAAADSSDAPPAPEQRETPEAATSIDPSTPESGPQEGAGP